MIVLTKEQIIRLHAELVAETGGSGGIRDEGMLVSALQAPFQSFDGMDITHPYRRKRPDLAMD